MNRSVLNCLLGLGVGMVFSFTVTIYNMTGTGGVFMINYRQVVTAGSKFDNRFTDGGDDGSVFTDLALGKRKPLIKPVEFNDDHVHLDDDTEAKRLAEKVRIFCWVMTSPNNHEKKAIHVKNTWGKRCNKLLFISSQANDTLPSIALNISEGREHLTGKTMMAFRLLYEKHIDEADWFMKADDDTYVILENLRYFLSSEDPDDPIYFGHHFKTIVKQDYLSGGGGYILSKEALRRFGRQANDSKLCRQDGGAEDAEFGICMQNLGVKVGNSTDSLGRSRFHCFPPGTHIHGGYPQWYYTSDAYGGKKGLDSVSDYAITFHYLTPKAMYGLEYYIYHLRPYGIRTEYQNLNEKPHRV